MLFSALALAALSAAALGRAAPTPEPAEATHELETRATSSACPQYVLINTRGTGEPQGESSGFRTMNSQITAALSGGTIYNTVYAADYSQNSAAGTADIIRRINSGLASNPNVCYILQGYSQGAAATVVALQQLGTSGAAFNAVKGVFLIGDPDHKAGLTCNVDSNGGTTTRNVNGLSVQYQGSIPSGWVSKTLDVCAYVRSDSAAFKDKD